MMNGPIVTTMDGHERMFMPYEVNFIHQGEIHVQKMLNHCPALYMAQREGRVGQFFCLSVDEKGSFIEVHLITQNQWGQLEEEVLDAFPCIARPLIRQTSQFFLRDIWYADGCWDKRKNVDEIWEKGYQIFPDDYFLLAQNNEELENEVNSLDQEWSDLFRAAGANDEYVLNAPDIRLAVCQKIGKTEIPFNLIEKDNPVIFWEGTIESGHNIVYQIDSENFYDHEEQFTKELLTAFQAENVNQLPQSIQETIETIFDEPLRLYVAPHQTLGQAIKRHYKEQQKLEKSQKRIR